MNRCGLCAWHGAFFFSWALCHCVFIPSSMYSGRDEPNLRDLRVALRRDLSNAGEWLSILSSGGLNMKVECSVLLWLFNSSVGFSF